MTNIINERLLSQVKDRFKHKYQRNNTCYIEDVVVTVEKMVSCKNLDDIMELVRGIFSYHYTKIEGHAKYNTKVHFKQNNKEVHQWWMIDPRFHDYIVDINKRILTFDSYNAGKYNKACLSGIIRDVDLIPLENYIREHHPNDVLMFSNKVIKNKRDYDKINHYIGKYKFKNPLYDCEGSWDRDQNKFTFDDGYQEFNRIFFTYENIVEYFFDFDRDILKGLGYRLGDIDKARRRLMNNLKSEDLYVVNFMGVKLNDNRLFEILSEFCKQSR